MVDDRFFSLDYREHATLGDGTEVEIRLVVPADKALLRAGFARLSPESRHARFLAPKASLSDDELRYLCELDHEQHFAIGAIRRDREGGAVGVGIARFIRFAEPANTAEAAITVADEVQHQGLGKLLFLRLVAAAAERGIELFRCEVLIDNAGMAALIKQIDPERSVAASHGVMSIELSLPRVAPTQPASESIQNPLYRLFRALAQNAVRWGRARRASAGRRRTTGRPSGGSSGGSGGRNRPRVPFASDAIRKRLGR